MSGRSALLTRAIDRAEFRHPAVAVGRSLLALSVLATIVLSPDSSLFPQVSEYPTGMRCDGFRAMSLWCVTGATDSGLLVSRVVSVVVLGIVAIGLSPRWTCVPHWYVTFSLASAVPLSNGGDNIAQIATMLLIAICLGDDRWWQWQVSARPLSPGWRGRAFAAHWALRCQLAVVYVAAAAAKLGDPFWTQGSALVLISRMSQYGLTPAVRDIAQPVLSSYWLVAVMGWSVIGTQLLIAVALLGPRKVRLAALVLGVPLHLGIAVFMHLTSFGLIMIAVLVIACVPAVRAERTGAELNGERRTYDTGRSGD